MNNVKLGKVWEEKILKQRQSKRLYIMMLQILNEIKLRNENIKGVYRVKCVFLCFIYERL